MSIDRDAIAQVIQEHSYAVEEGRYGKPGDWADRILALVRPVEGVTLTPEEARLASSALRNRANELRYRARINPVDAAVMGADTDALRALAARLEASS